MTTKTEREVVRAAKRIFDFFFPWCPSGWPHRINPLGGIVVNVYGFEHCWHHDCIRESIDEILQPPPCGGGPDHDKYERTYTEFLFRKPIPCPACARHAKRGRK